jgi:hypothetical protein
MVNTLVLLVCRVKANDLDFNQIGGSDPDRSISSSHHYSSERWTQVGTEPGPPRGDLIVI